MDEPSGSKKRDTSFSDNENEAHDNIDATNDDDVFEGLFENPVGSALGSGLLHLIDVVPQKPNSCMWTLLARLGISLEEVTLNGSLYPERFVIRSRDGRQLVVYNDSIDSGRFLLEVAVAKILNDAPMIPKTTTRCDLSGRQDDVMKMAPYTVAAGTKNYEIYLERLTYCERQASRLDVGVVSPLNGRGHLDARKIKGGYHYYFKNLPASAVCKLSHECEKRDAGATLFYENKTIMASAWNSVIAASYNTMECGGGQCALVLKPPPRILYPLAYGPESVAELERVISVFRDWISSGGAIVLPRPDNIKECFTLRVKDWPVIEVPKTVMKAIRKCAVSRDPSRRLDELGFGPGVMLDRFGHPMTNPVYAMLADVSNRTIGMSMPARVSHLHHALSNPALYKNGTQLPLFPWKFATRYACVNFRDDSGTCASPRAEDGAVYRNNLDTFGSGSSYTLAGNSDKEENFKATVAAVKEGY